MSELPVFDPIEYLVSKRYPDIRRDKTLPDHARGSVWRAAQIYRKMLQSMPAPEFREYLSFELKRPAANNPSIVRQVQVEPSDLQLLDADFDFWACMPAWTLEEAMALSLGQDPEKVSWKEVQKYPGTSDFVKNFSRRRKIMMRHHVCQRLSDPVAPGRFVAWAKHTNIEISDKLVEAVSKHGHEIADWKDFFLTQKALHGKHNARWTEISKKLRDQRERAFENAAKFRSELRTREDEIRELQDRCRSLERQSGRPASSSAKPSSEKPINTKEKESLLKITIGLAVVGYKFDPSAKRNSSVKEMHDDVTSLGLTICEDTIRKFLREGGELLPPDYQS